MSAEEQPQKIHRSALLTEWGANVTAANAWREYPRPQLVRGDSSWRCLNGHWEYAITAADDPQPSAFDGAILVPFPQESRLSGVQRLLLPNEALWYRREFDVQSQPSERHFLRFEAVDYACEVWLNSILLGYHTGGSTPFSFELTAAMKAAATATGSVHTLVVRVLDPTDGTQLRGKQSPQAEGIFYTRCSGIWQSVWLETVPAAAHIEELIISADLTTISLRTMVSVAAPARTEEQTIVAVEAAAQEAEGAEGAEGVEGAPLPLLVSVEARDGDGKLVAVSSQGVILAPQRPPSALARSGSGYRRAEVAVTLRVGGGGVEEARLWSPESPHLYSLRVVLRRHTPQVGGGEGEGEGEVVDEVTSYAGMRTVGTMRDAAGHLRLTLNGASRFQLGPLDQGWWPDGLLAPPSDAAMRYDIEFAKACGFNMIRKHIKVEPSRWYYHCDRLGMLVWQDQPSGFDPAAWPPERSPMQMFPPWTRMQPAPVEAHWSEAAHAQFMAELGAMVTMLHNNPCVVVWVPFNEAWGQHDTVKVAQWLARRDPSRLVNAASGGNFWPVGHMADQHAYPHPDFPFDAPRYDELFVKVVGEYGGHGLAVAGHLWDEAAQNWGYGGLAQAGELLERYRESASRLLDLKSRGVAAGVYTQATDVEGEVNGLLTYDRKVAKIAAETLRAIHQPLVEG